MSVLVAVLMLEDSLKATMHMHILLMSALVCHWPIHIGSMKIRVRLVNLMLERMVITEMR